MSRRGDWTLARVDIMELRKIWRRVHGRERPHNVLAVSDLHLGIDLKAGARRPAAELIDDQLVSFLNHHRQYREDGKPWKLLLNGDIIDFVAITLTPKPGEETFEVR